MAIIHNPQPAGHGFRTFRRVFFTDRYRKIPLLLTVGLHLAVLLFSLVAPFIMTSGTPRIPEVYSVDLYSAPEEAAPPPPAPKVVELTAPARKKEATPTPVQKEAAAPPVMKEAVSLAPVRQRLAKEIKEMEARKRREEVRRSEVEQLRMEYLRERAEKEAQQAEQALAAAKAEAAARIADIYRASDRSRRESQAPGVETGTEGDKGGGDRQKLEALDRYRARLFEHISPHWQLPELQEWDEDLRAVIVMEVNRDGTVTSSYFEKRSKDSRFNRYVQKAIDNARPLPPFPLDFHEKSEQIVVTFSPGGLL